MGNCFSKCKTLLYAFLATRLKCLARAREVLTNINKIDQANALKNEGKSCTKQCGINTEVDARSFGSGRCSFCGSGLCCKPGLQEGGCSGNMRKSSKGKLRHQCTGTSVDKAVISTKYFQAFYKGAISPMLELGCCDPQTNGGLDFCPLGQKEDLKKCMKLTGPNSHKTLSRDLTCDNTHECQYDMKDGHPYNCQRKGRNRREKDALRKKLAAEGTQKQEKVRKTREANRESREKRKSRKRNKRNNSSTRSKQRQKKRKEQRRQMEKRKELWKKKRAKATNGKKKKKKGKKSSATKKAKPKSAQLQESARPIIPNQSFAIDHSRARGRAYNLPKNLNWLGTEWLPDKTEEDDSCYSILAELVNNGKGHFNAQDTLKVNKKYGLRFLDRRPEAVVARRLARKKRWRARRRGKRASSEAKKRHPRAKERAWKKALHAKGKRL